MRHREQILILLLGNGQQKPASTTDSTSCLIEAPTLLELSHFVCRVSVREIGDHGAVVRGNWSLHLSARPSFEDGAKHDRFTVPRIFRSVDQRDLGMPLCRVRGVGRLQVTHLYH